MTDQKPSTSTDEVPDPIMEELRQEQEMIIAKAGDLDRAAHALKGSIELSIVESAKNKLQAL